MTIFCKLCGTAFTSLHLADPQRDVLTQMSRHMARHQEQASALAQGIVQTTHLLATYLLIKKYVRVPESETELLASFRENERILKEIFELEPAKDVVE